MAMQRVDLALRDRLAIFPVGGWWKATGDKERNNGTMRYSLVVTIDAGDVEQDLWVKSRQDRDPQ
jgi:hypothetical protein